MLTVHENEFEFTIKSKTHMTDSKLIRQAMAQLDVIFSSGRASAMAPFVSYDPR